MTVHELVSDRCCGYGVVGELLTRSAADTRLASRDLGSEVSVARPGLGTGQGL